MKKKAVNFRLPYELIFELTDAAQAQGMTVTDLLIRYCEQGLQNDTNRILNTDSATVNTDSSTVNTDVDTDKIYSAIATAIAPLQLQIDGLRQELGESNA
jgi:ribosome-associated translation inhibitor RaiA